MSATASVTAGPAPETHGRADCAEPPLGLSIDVVVEDAAWAELAAVEAVIRDAAAAVSRHGLAGVKAGMEAAVALDTDAVVRRLNHQFRGLDKPTNVLSFPSDNRAGGHLGDIILARETVVAEADQLGVPVAHHLQHLTVHGLLHLLGFDHEADGDATEMETLETEILATLGIPDPYADSDVIASN
jgi:probable rRNA maturation factor